MTLVARVCFISFMGLLFVANACWANDRLRAVPYNPSIDFPKLADDIGISQKNTIFHGRCVYIQLVEWAANVGLESIRPCVFALTEEQLVLVSWKEETKTYMPIFKFGYGEIRRTAISVEGTKYQLQLSTSSGFFAITIPRHGVPPPGDSSPAAEIFRYLEAKGVTVADSPGRVDLKMPSYRLIPLGRH